MTKLTKFVGGKSWSDHLLFIKNSQNIGILVFNQNFSPINPPKPPKKSPLGNTIHKELL